MNACIQGSVLVTGAAGFIGFHVAQRLLEQDIPVIGLDCFSDYYDVTIKRNRTQKLLDQFPKYRIEEVRLEDKEGVKNIWQRATPAISHVAHLAAQAGVRYSLENPYAYISSNINGHLVLLETIRHAQNPLKNFVFASTSSVYGANPKQPFSEDQQTETPMSLYAATKKSDELMTSAYAHLFKIPSIGLRFFTVYGPWGRPDMALFKFTRNILQDNPIPVFNHGKMKRDFTYIDDIVDGILLALLNPPQANDYAPYAVYNLGNNRAESLMDYIEALESCLGIKAKKEFFPLQKADVPETHADISRAHKFLGYQPKTSIQEGVAQFVRWYKDYYR